jgi:hypothetical protein
MFRSIFATAAVSPAVAALSARSASLLSLALSAALAD